MHEDLAEEKNVMWKMCSLIVNINLQMLVVKGYNLFAL